MKKDKRKHHEFCIGKPTVGIGNNMMREGSGAIFIGLLIGLICGYYFGQIHAWGQCADLCENMDIRK